MATHVWHHPAHDRQPVPLPRIHEIGDVQQAVLVVGRLLFGGFFLYSGIHHFMDVSTMTGFAAAKGVPFPEASILLTGAMLAIGGLSLMLGYRPRVGAGLIALFLIAVTPMMHNFWTEQGAQRMSDMGNFAKNVALLGGACFVASVPEPWPVSARRVKSVVVGGLIALMSTSLGPSLSAAQKLPERFTAFAVNFDAPYCQVAKVIQIGVTRWSSDAERDRLMSVLVEKGPEKLLDAVQDLPSAGYIRTPDSLGYDLRYARRTVSDDGTEQITLVTDRFISYWEATNQPNSIHYPFTVIDLRIGPNGEGEGKASVATRITADPRHQTIVLENYSAQPVLLQSVKREKS